MKGLVPDDVDEKAVKLIPPSQGGIGYGAGGGGGGGDGGDGSSFLRYAGGDGQHGFIYVEWD